MEATLLRQWEERVTWKMSKFTEINIRARGKNVSLKLNFCLGGKIVQEFREIFQIIFFSCDFVFNLRLSDLNYSVYFFVSIFFKKTQLKVGLSPSKKICVIYFIEGPLKMMKNAFYLILKALFILKILKFLS